MTDVAWRRISQAHWYAFFLLFCCFGLVIAAYILFRAHPFVFMGTPIGELIQSLADNANGDARATAAPGDFVQSQVYNEVGPGTTTPTLGTPAVVAVPIHSAAAVPIVTAAAVPMALPPPAPSSRPATDYLDAIVAEALLIIAVVLELTASFLASYTAKRIKAREDSLKDPNERTMLLLNKFTWLGPPSRKEEKRGPQRPALVAEQVENKAKPKEVLITLKDEREAPAKEDKSMCGMGKDLAGIGAAGLGAGAALVGNIGAEAANLLHMPGEHLTNLVPLPGVVGDATQALTGGATKLVGGTGALLVDGTGQLLGGTAGVVGGATQALTGGATKLVGGTGALLGGGFLGGKTRSKR